MELKITPSRQRMLYRIFESGPMLVKGGSVRNYLEQNNLIYGAGMIRTSITARGYATYTQTYDTTVEGMRVLGKALPAEDSPGPVNGEPQMFMSVPPGYMPWANKEVHYQLGEYIVAPHVPQFSTPNMNNLWNLYKDDKPVTITNEPFSPWYCFRELEQAFEEIEKRTADA